ncbi:hypothetical protein SSX86_015487 [Deinandra increscens subsp. villosa]|uniref:DUF632 domain-containing protein n=1 Tax=Deinandra increscens subsp. villosa TaxID=3103831 RepID=A0AAP0CZW6_9ASTR
MGCSESKIENVTTVNRCKERIAFMKQSVTAHAAFVSAYSAYTATLNTTSTALSDYAQSELQSLDDRLLPPHPPHRSLHPNVQHDGVLAWDFFIALMVDDKHGGGGVAEVSGEGTPPSSVKKHMKNVNMVKLFRKLDDGFVKGSDSAFEVSKVHETNKLHYNSKFEDNQGQSKHSNSAKLDSSSKEKQTHTTLLEKMLAWEKKLYDQVKAGEMMKHEYRKRIALLNMLRKRGSSSDRLKQTEATVNDMHTRYIVEMQSIDSTVSEINRLRDEQLYPKLVQIIEEMGEMWKNMRKQHEQQLTIVKELSNIKISESPKSTSEHNLKNMEQIRLQVMICCSKFEKFMLYQKEYIKSLSNWLKLNLISIDNNVHNQNPKIKSLLRTWRDQLKKLPEQGAKTAINSFAVCNR